MTKKTDLDRQQMMLLCSQRDGARITKDLGSGMNYRKKGLQSLLDKILRKQMRRLVLTHKDRLHLVWVRASICSM